MATVLQDPKQISNTTNPTERDKHAAVPLEVMWERQFEIEAKDNGVNTFQANGSIDFQIQVEDKQVKHQEFNNSDLWMDMFKKPLEGLTNIAGGIANETPDALIDLGKKLVGETAKQPEIQPEKQKEAQVAQWQNFVTQKRGETNAAISQVTMQRKIEEVLYIVGAPPTEDTAAELDLNTAMDVQNLYTVDKHVWRARKTLK